MNPDVFLQGLLNGFLNGIVYALLAMGFTIMYGTLNMVNFFHGAQVMVAMYIAYVLNINFIMDPYLSMFLILPLFILIGMLFYKVILSKVKDKPHPTQILVTLSLWIFVENGCNFIFGGNLRSINTPYSTSSIMLGSVSLQLSLLYAAAFALLIILIIAFIINRTDIGASMRASSSNYLGALLVGVKVEKVYLFAVSLVFIATTVVGIVMTPYSLVSPIHGGTLLEKAFLVTVMGGLGSFNGALLAGVIIGILEVMSGLFFKPEFTNAIVFGLLMVVILIKPEGLLGNLPG
jgi:branched-chain amino acid transport system permease protein